MPFFANQRRTRNGTIIGLDRRSSRGKRSIYSGNIGDLLYKEDPLTTRLIRKTTPGAGPSTFTEQNSRVYSFLTKDPKAESYRASGPEDCTYGAWVPNIKDPDKVYGIQKYEILFRIIDPSEEGSRTIPIRSGVPTIFGLTSVTNLRKGLEIEVLGGVRNPSASRGETKIILDPAGTCVEGGTDSMPNSGPFRIHPGDNLYGIVEPYTRPCNPDDGGHSGFESMHKMKGLADKKFLLQIVPLAAADIHEIVASKVNKVNRLLNELIYKTDTRRMDPTQQHQRLPVDAPSLSELRKLVQDVYNDLDASNQSNKNAESRIRGFQAYMVLHTLYAIIRHGVTVQADSFTSTENQQSWKNRVEELYVDAAKHLADYYKDEYNRLPTQQQLWSSMEWKKKLPFFIDYRYQPDQAFEQMKVYSMKEISHVEHIMIAIETVCKKSLQNMTLWMKRRFIGSALSGAESGYPVDYDVKRV